MRFFLPYASARGLSFHAIFDLLACSAILVGGLSAQTAHFSGATVVVNTSVVPNGVAVDGSGNVFVSDVFHSAVYEILAGTGGAAPGTINPNSTVNTLGSGFSQPWGVALDSNDNVFVADTGNNAVKEILAAGGYTTVNTLAVANGNFILPPGIAVDAIGNVFVADYGNGAVKEILAAGGYTTVNTLSSSFSLPTGVAVDGSGNVFVSDGPANQVYEILAVGGSIPSSPTIAALGSGILSPWGLALDGSGDLFVADVGNNAVKEMVAVGGSIPASPTILSLGSGFNRPTSVALDKNGNILVADNATQGVLEIMPAAANFYSQPVGSTSAPIALTFTFDSAGTIQAPLVLTHGAANLPNPDFRDAGTDTCTSNGTSFSYNIGDTCTVDVTFTPAHPGPVTGAVELLDSSGNVISTAFLQGTGTGPQVAFPSNPIETILASGFSAPYGIATDRSGNVILADFGNGAVREMLAAGGYTTINTLGSGFSAPFGIAVDGAGNVFVSDSFTGSVKEISAAGGYSTVTTVAAGFNNPVGIALDGNGDIFVVEKNTGTIKEILAQGGGFTVTTVASGFTTPTNIAVDGTGNLFVTDYPNHAVKEIVAASGYTTVITISTAFVSPFGVAVDAAGDVFVTDYANHAVSEILAGGGYTTILPLTGNLYVPESVAVDYAGHLFIGSQGQVTKVDLSQPPSFSFAATPVYATSNDSPQTVTMANDGNAPLVFPLPSAGTNPSVDPNFSWDPASTCTQTSSTDATAFSLASGVSCTAAIDFTPTTTGSLAGNLIFTDNNLNASPGMTQKTSLSGTGTPTPFGGVDSWPFDTTTLRQPVCRCDSYRITGWAADGKDGAPVSQVQIFIDGNPVGLATTGFARPAISAANGKQYLNSGWIFTASALSVPTGVHTLTAVATDSQSLSTTIGTTTLRVSSTQQFGPPVGKLDEAVDAISLTSLVLPTHQLLVHGWAIDGKDGAPIKATVQVFIDNNFVGDATLGFKRTDVPFLFGNTYAKSGWRFNIAASSLGTGTHTVYVVITNSAGLSITSATKSFKIEPL